MNWTTKLILNWWLADGDLFGVLEVGGEMNLSAGFGMGVEGLYLAILGPLTVWLDKDAWKGYKRLKWAFRK